jgi:hypothetical protein
MACGVITSPKPTSICSRIFDLQPDLRCREARYQHGANPTVLLLLPNRADLERARIEHESVVVDLGLDDVTENASNPVRARISETEQVNVPSRAMGLLRPQHEKCSSLQHEAASVPRLRQTIETLVRVPREQELKVVTATLGEAKQASADGRREVPGRFRHDVSASMYGRMNA